jgi:hypothetical protein
MIIIEMLLVLVIYTIVLVYNAYINLGLLT